MIGLFFGKIMVVLVSLIGLNSAFDEELYIFEEQDYSELDGLFDGEEWFSLIVLRLSLICLKDISMMT